MKLAGEALLPRIALLNKVPKRSGVECSTIARLVARKNTLHMYLTAELAGMTSIDWVGEPEKWAINIEREPLMAFLATCGVKDEVTIVCDGKTFEMKVGKRKLTLNGSGDVSGYMTELMPDLTPLKIGKELQTYMELACAYAEDTPLSPEIACVYLDSGKGVAAIYRKTTLLWIETSKPKSTVTINPTMVPLLPGATVSLVTNGLVLEYPEGYLFKASSNSPADFPIAALQNGVARMGELPVTMTIQAAKANLVLTRLGGFLRTSDLAEPMVQLEPIPPKKGEVLAIKAVKLTLQAGSAKFHETLPVIHVPHSGFEINLARVLPLLGHLEAEDEIYLRVDTNAIHFSTKLSPYKLLVSRQAT